MAEPLEQFMARIYDEQDKEKFETVLNYLDNNSNNYSKQEAFLFAVRLANAKIQEKYSRDVEINSNLP